MNFNNHNCAVVIKEPDGMYSVKEYGWTREAPYDHPGNRPFLRTRGLYATHAQAADSADWINYPELRREKP